MHIKQIMKAMVGLGLGWVVLGAHAFDLGGLRADEVSVFAQNLDTGRIVVEHRADELVNPASTMKLVTAWHSLNSLGPQHRVRTYWHSRAPIENGVLKGDLVWRGSGDPLFGQEDLRQMLQQLQARGVRHIQGKLVLDQSLWRNVPSALDFDDDDEAAFTVAPHPHMLNYHVVWLQYQPNEAARWQITPPLANVVVNDALVRRTSGACGRLKKRLRSTWNANGQIVLNGSVSASCAQAQMYSKGVVGGEYAYKAFLGLWKGLDGTGAEGFVISDQPVKAGRILVQHDSLSVSEMVKRMNKYSNNVIARSLVLLAQNSVQADGNQALQYMRQALQKTGWGSEVWVIENGSGLSRTARVNARGMGKMLQAIHKSPMKPVFWESLPIAGVDGTLRTRLKPWSGRLFLKTGTLSGVKALSGYGINAQGQTVALSIFINGTENHHTTEQLDQLAGRILLASQQ